jgi:hypothetical protein
MRTTKIFHAIKSMPALSADIITIKTSLTGQDAEASIPYGTYSLLDLLEAARKAAQIPSDHEVQSHDRRADRTSWPS